MTMAPGSQSEPVSGWLSRPARREAELQHAQRGFGPDDQHQGEGRRVRATRLARHARQREGVGLFARTPALEDDEDLEDGVVLRALGTGLAQELTDFAQRPDARAMLPDGDAHGLLHLLSHGGQGGS